MRLVLIAAAFLAVACPLVFADRSASMGQLGDNAEATGTRSNAALNQIGRRASESGGLADQIDPETVTGIDDIDESLVGETLPAAFDTMCTLTPNQEAVLDYLRAEGRVFENDCQVLAWLEDNGADRRTSRDLFNIIFGPEAERQKKAELARAEAERARAEALRRLQEAAEQGARPE